MMTERPVRTACPIRPARPVGVSAEIRAAELAHDGGNTAEAIRRLRAALEPWSASPLGDLVDEPLAAPWLVMLAEERARAVELLYRWELEEGHAPSSLPSWRLLSSTILCERTCGAT